MAAFVLKFDNNVVEHLGLKLYQNKPTRVVAEVASNSWDAGAREVLVNMNMALEGRWISVIDDGYGMTREELENLYLVIGLTKRPTSKTTTPSGTIPSRPPMGRKGIGKLAPFGIARQVDVVTAGHSSEGVEITWLRLDLRKVLAMGSKGSYYPEEIFQGNRFEDIPVQKDATSQVATWITHVTRSGADRLGTLVLMHDLSLGKAISEAQLIESLGRRFTVTLRDSFVVKVNGTVVEQVNALPAFEFRIPETGEELAPLEIPMPGDDGLSTTLEEKQVRYWVGFVGEADWSQDQAGIGVYAHGKIAQDRPFTFGSKGQEIWTRYMYGVVEADWLAELPDDLISTDRTSVNWDADAARPLQEWGHKKVGEWARKYAAWRKEEERKENAQRVKEQQGEEGAAPVTDTEQEQIVELVSQITPRMGKDEAAKVKLIRAVSEAWIQKPMQKLVRDLWSELGETDKLPPEAFAGVITKLSAHGVPESLNLAVVFAQRAFALTKLHEYVHHGIELDLQRLIERFPWIIEPDAAVLTANQTLRIVVNRAEREGQIPAGRRTNVGGTSDENRPDFVFLSSPEERDIVVVELKSPQQDLTIENRRQLEDYLTYLEVHYPNARIAGVLVGRNPNKMTVKHVDTRIVEWTEVLKRSRARHLELLAAMLIQAADGTRGDARIEGAMLLGGPEARQMLDKLAEHHTELRNLMVEMDARASRASSKPKSESNEPAEDSENDGDDKKAAESPKRERASPIT